MLEDAEIHFVKTGEEVENFFRWLSEDRNWLAWDCETEGLNFHKDKMRLFQFGDTGAAWVFRADRWLGVLEDTFRRYRGRLVGHNISFDSHFADGVGITMPWANAHDTMLMSKTLSPNTSAALKTCASKLMGADMKKAQGALDSAMKVNKWTWKTVPVDFDIYWGYAGADCILTCALAEHYFHKVEEDFSEVYALEMQVAQICNGMERRGVAIDLAYCERMYEEIINFTSGVEVYCQETWGVRPSESQKVAEVLRKEGVDLTQLTESGKWAMDKTTLGEIRHPLAELVMQHRQKTKVGSAYFENFLKMHHNGRLHCSIRTMAARTGRSSISDPALQTIPRGTVVRDAFLPDPGSGMYSVDYSGIEARMFAHFANEEELIRVFHEGFDPHTYTAQQVFNVETPTKLQRQVSKNATFAMLFGASAQKVGWTAGVTTEEADAFMVAYKKRFPGVPIFMKTIEATAKHRYQTEGMGYVKTPLGRLQVGDNGKYYVLVNALIQGTAADVLKKAMVNLDNAGFGENMIIPIHDELLFNLQTDEQAKEVVELMEDHASYRVPLQCESVGPVARWGDKVRIEAGELTMDYLKGTN